MIMMVKHDGIRIRVDEAFDALVASAEVLT